jgi:hypothetical protein
MGPARSGDILVNASAARVAEALCDNIAVPLNICVEPEGARADGSC